MDNLFTIHFIFVIGGVLLLSITLNIWIFILYRKVSKKQLQSQNSYQDILSQMRAQEAEHTAYYTNQFFHVLDHLPIPIMVKDVQHDFRYLYWNKEAALQSTVCKEEVIGKTDFDIYPEERAAAYRKVDEELLISKKFTCEETYQLPDGTERFSIVTKSLLTNYESSTWLLAARWDITERKKAEQQTLEMMNTNKLIFDNINIGLVYINLEFIVQWESVANLGVLSLSQHYKPGKPCYETVYNRRKPCSTCPIVEMIKSQSSANQVHCIDNRHVDITANPVFDDAGKIIGSILRMEDITEKKRIEVELEAARESNKLKSAFLANMSHEIRTPLNAIVGFSNILIQTEDPEEKKEYAKIIINNNQLLLQLIGDILDLSKIESDTLEFVYSDFDVNELINGIAQHARMRVGNSKIDICIEEQLPSCLIYSEKTRLSQVLTNFVANALKFTKTGSITLGYQFIQNNSFIYFYVIDTGCGIENEKIITIFDRFVKLNSFSQGTGLGLSICRTIIERLGGQIGVESELNQGSTFWFTIPYKPALSKPIPVESLPAPASVKRTSRERFTILIAEDNLSNFRLFESILGKEYNLLHAWNGKEAFELFKESAPHLILMDIKMPQMDGYEATTLIRKYSPNVPIIATTAYALSSTEEQVMKTGFNGYITKPLQRSVLKQRIQDLLSSRFVII